MKRTRLERAEAAAKRFEPSGDDLTVGYRCGWLDGHAAGTRDAQRRLARKFKRGLRLSWDKP